MPTKGECSGLPAFGALAAPGNCRIKRLVVGECDRLPEIARTFYELTTVPADAPMGNWLAAQRERDTRRIDDSHIACGLVRAMMTMKP